MGCPSECQIGDNLVFSVTTHDPDTGVLTDADAVPTYRVYEDETATPILTGSMAKLDDANTTGFYAEAIACTAANGFENGKTYTVYVVAIVDSDSGGISYAFKAKGITGISENAALNLLVAKLLGDRVYASNDEVSYDDYNGTVVLKLKKSGNAVTRTEG
jgi:hypothetical protein